MTAAIALAVVLVIAVAGASMAMESQRAATPGARRPPRPTPSPGPTIRRPRMRDRAARSAADVSKAETPADPAPTPAPSGPELKGPELLRSGVAAEAKVISVVDERTIGPVTRSRLALRVQPADGPAFEVTLRVAFQTPESRARVKVGGTVPVRYDREDRTRVVVDLPQD